MTFDEPCPGLVVTQPKRGFRYGAEAFWLAGFGLEIAPGARTVLDLGTGSGIVAGLTAARGRSAVGIDLEPSWAPLWSTTLTRSRLSGSLRLVAADVRSWDEPADLVLCNPPFFPKGTGPVAPDAGRAAARTEGEACLVDFVAAAARCVDPRGAVAFVLPLTRVDEVVGALASGGLGVTEIVTVGARRVIVAARPGASAPARVDRVVEGGARPSAWYAAAKGESVAAAHVDVLDGPGPTE